MRLPQKNKINPEIKWVYLTYLIDGVKISNINEFLGVHLPSSIRLSHDGYGSIDFGSIDISKLTVVAETLIDDIPVVKIIDQ